MGRLFGTDGVRGLANADLSPELAMQVSEAAVRVLVERAGESAHRPSAVVGRDPRVSGEMLEAAVAAGLSAAGADVLRLGVLPTPAVAHLTAAFGVDLGVMISASHNPMPDNGIKIFAEGGHKLPDAVEDAIEVHVDEARSGSSVPAGGGPFVGRPTGRAIGRIRDAADATERYVAHLAAATPVNLTGLSVVVDCAHGAASWAAPAAYARAGATVVPLNTDPDGWNINDGVGSTHLEPLQQAVVEHGADLGIAHDGDADRCLAVASDGSVVDGDQILAVLAIDLRERGELVEDTLVATVMSNLGLRLAMTEAGIALRTTAVGDRYVLEELRAGGFSLGGEQSGHVVLPGYATTGDGLLTALRLMARMVSSGRSLTELAGAMTRLPQVLVNVPVSDKAAVGASSAVAEAVAAAESELGGRGRVLLRPSGTEQLVRVMVEAPSESVAGAVADRLAGLVSTIR